MSFKRCHLLGALLEARPHCHSYPQQRGPSISTNVCCSQSRGLPLLPSQGDGGEACQLARALRQDKRPAPGRAVEPEAPSLGRYESGGALGPGSSVSSHLGKQKGKGEWEAERPWLLEHNSERGKRPKDLRVVPRSQLRSGLEPCSSPVAVTGIRPCPGCATIMKTSTRIFWWLKEK